MSEWPLLVRFVLLFRGPSQLPSKMQIYVAVELIKVNRLTLVTR